MPDNQMWQHTIRVEDQDFGPGLGGGGDGEVKQYYSGVSPSILPKGMYRADSPVIGVYTDTGEVMDTADEQVGRDFVAIPVESFVVDTVPDRGPCLIAKDRRALVKRALAQAKLKGYTYAHSVTEQRLFPETPKVVIRVRAAKFERGKTSDGS